MKRKDIGVILLVLGLIVGVGSLLSDTSVDVNYGVGGNPLHMPDKVENLGLMNRKIGGLIAAGVLSIIGVILIVAPEDNSKLIAKQNELLESQNKVNTAQLFLLASIADKLGVPVNDINEVVEEYGAAYE